MYKRQAQNPGDSGDAAQNPGDSGDAAQNPGDSGDAAQNPGDSGDTAQNPGDSGDAAQNSQESSGVDEGTIVALDTKAAPAPEENEETVKIPVRWVCDNYDGWTADRYTFTADLGKYQYNNSSEFSLTVIVKAPSSEIARIGSTTYSTFDEAVKAAADGDTIELLGNCTTDGMNLSKNLTVTSEEGQTYTLNFVKDGIALWGKALTFENCNILMNGIGSTPYVEWSWMAICANKDASLTLNQVTMTMDAEGVTNNPHAIYFCSNNRLNLTDSTLVIRNYPQDALEWDGGDGGYNVNITDSTFISDNNRSGFTGTFYATIKNSDVQVINSKGNGSNGSHFIIEESTVDFSDNGSHGLSAGELSITSSTVTASGNNGMGIAVGNALSITDNSTVTVTDNATNASYGYAGMRLYNNYDFTVDATSKLYIKDNHNTGLYVRQGTLTVEEGATLEITGNSVSNTLLDGYGGGVYVGYGNNYDPTVILPTNAVICNNHATAGGDDLYVSEGVDGPSLTFYTVGSDWVLDDCDDAIDGWYDDSPDARWSAHEKPLHAVEFTNFDHRITTVSGPTYLKAAHGLIPVEPEDPTLPDWEVSKSKEATNLDDNYESQVTLSLPAAQEPLASDIVFVVDKSTSSREASTDGGLDMLSDLAYSLESTQATINVGIIVFDGTYHVMRELSPYDAADVAEKMSAPIPAEEDTSGTNMEAGLLAAKTMLEADDRVPDNRKHVILVSDGLTRLFTGPDGETVQIIFNELEADGTRYFGEYTTWCLSNGFSDGEYKIPGGTDWLTYYNNVIKPQVEADGDTYVMDFDGDSTKVGTAPDRYIPMEEVDDHAQAIDRAFYDAYQAYLDLSSTYHFYAFYTGNSELGSGFMSTLNHGEDVDFGSIRDGIYYLLDAGSKVVDVIGYGTDNKGNEYDFDFVNDISTLTLTVNGEELPARELDVTDGFFTGSHETACYVFGDLRPMSLTSGYPFALHYYANGEDGQSDECFVWEINVPVSNFAPVELTYSVKLTNPQTADGTYGQFDADGSEHFDSLLTNLNATLYPVDSNGDQGMPEYFAKPTVSYTNTTPGGGGGGDDDDDDDDGGTNIPDENTPTTDVPGTDIPDENTPTTDVPGTDLEDPDVPLADVPKTGDVSALWLALSALSGTGLAGVTFLGRKKRDEE
ncbi:MAG: VWA domain-containing protein [Dysosmobacter sp.]|uniref:VWA domain-containing protein n=1 Tax=Dysosmobacter sp. TaxID=2591382 RepID=UPI00283C93EA|nr:VWA domain-containing protein [Dysosmobacter sp.]MDR3983984.1 VWA domain-containing protein [Dysosmobacter sp.]